jgi:type IV secretory pathway VirB10-like protein
MINKAAIAGMGLVALTGAAGMGAFIASQRSQHAVETTAPSLAASGVEATEAVVEPLPDVEKPAASEPAAPVAAEPAPRVVTRNPEVRRPAPAPAVARNAPSVPAASRPAPTRTETPARQAPPPVEPAQPVATTAERADAVSPQPPTDSYAGDTRPTPEPVASVPAAPRFEELTVPAEAVIGLQLESTITSESARVEDRVEARVTRDVRSNGRVAIPSGSRVLGSVSVVERGGKMKERARLGVRFHTIILADGTELPVQTDTVYREGEAPGNASAAKVGGGAIGGAILGAILGGGKGAAIGAGVGAGAGTAAVMAGGRRAAEIRAGSPVTVKVLSPVTVTVER